MANLGTMDYVLIISYFVVLIFIGIYLHKKASASMEDYFLAGRSLPWWALGISGLGWSLDITGTMLICSLLYLLGPRGLFVEFRGGVPLGLIFVMAWTGKWHRRSGCMTGAEWQVYRFGNGLGGKCARVISAVAGIVFTIGMLAYLVKGIGLFLSTFIPQLSPLQCSLIMVSVATLYTIASGFYGVVYSDIFQAGLILVGIIIVTTLAISKASGCESIAALSEQISGTKQWMSSFPQIKAAMPAGYQMYECLFMFIVFLILRNIIMGLGTGNTPQYFAARNERECGKIACLWSGLLALRWPMMIGYAILGLFLVKDMFPDMNNLAEAAAQIKIYIPEVTKAQWPDTLAFIANNTTAHPELAAKLQGLFGSNWSGSIQMLSFEGTVNAEKVLPSVLLYMVPNGFRGLILITLIAASMSTFDSTVNLASALFTRDIYQAFFRKAAKNKELMWATYSFTVIMVVFGYIIGYWAESINDIWGWLVMGLCSGLAIPGVLRLYWWRFNGQGFAIGTFSGMFAAIVQRIFWPQMSEQMQFVIISIISLVCTITGTYLTKPTEQKVLENFYRTTRPFGLWGPFKNLFNQQQRKILSLEHKYDLISLPFIFLWMVSLYLMPMQLMIGSYKSFEITAAIFVISVIGIYKFWVKNNYADEFLTLSGQIN